MRVPAGRMTRLSKETGCARTAMNGSPSRLEVLLTGVSSVRWTSVPWMSWRGSAYVGAGRTTDSVSATTKIKERTAFMKILLLHVRAGIGLRNVERGPLRVAWRWRADQASDANGSEAVGEELQPEDSVPERIRGPEGCLRDVLL